MNLKNIQNGDLRRALGYMCFSKITLAISGGSASPNVSSTGSIITTQDGLFNTTSALSGQSLVPTHDCFGNAVGGSNLSAYVQPISTTAYYLVAINSSDTVAVVQGSYSGQSLAFPDKQRVLTGTGNVPPEPTGYTAIGIVKVVTNGSATFTPGTTNLDASGVTATFYDVCGIPGTTL